MSNLRWPLSAPPAKLDVPCNKSSDCNTEDEAGVRTIRRDAGDGERNGLAGGPNAGFGCDIDGFNTISCPAAAGW
jgi:hypothetical protein